MECRVTALMLVYQLVMAVFCNAIDVVILITVLAKNSLIFCKFSYYLLLLYHTVIANSSLSNWIYGFRL